MKSIFILFKIDTHTSIHEPYTAVQHTVMDGHSQSVHRIRSRQGYIATGTVMGAALWAPYIRNVWVTVASPNADTNYCSANLKYAEG